MVFCFFVLFVCFLYFFGGVVLFVCFVLFVFVSLLFFNTRIKAQHARGLLQISPTDILTGN